MALNRDGLTSFAASKLGQNYVWGGTGNGGYDCSGLTYKAYESQGVSIPRVAQDQYNKSTKINSSNLQKGDLVFFSDTGSTNNVTHVGMYIGNGQYIHAANSKQGVITSTLNTQGSYFVGAGTFGGAGGGAVSSGSTSSTGSTSSDGLQFSGLSGFTSITDDSGNVVGMVDASGNYVSNAIPNAVESVGSWKDKILIFLGHVVKALTLLGIFALAAVLFTKAFDIKIGGNPLG